MKTDLSYMQVSRVVRQARPAKGRYGVAVKPLDMIVVRAWLGYTEIGLNMHACGKVEFFRDAQYACPNGVEFDAMMEAAKRYN